MVRAENGGLSMMAYQTLKEQLADKMTDLSIINQMIEDGHE